MLVHLQHDSPSIGVPGLAFQCAKEIAAIRRVEVDVIQEAVRDNIIELYKIKRSLAALLLATRANLIFKIF